MRENRGNFTQEGSLFKLLGMGADLFGLADVPQDEDDAADFLLFDHGDAEHLRHERPARTVVEAEIVSDQRTDAFLGGFVERAERFVADQHHIRFLTEDFLAGVAEQELRRGVHLSDAQIGGEDDDAFLEIICDGVLNLDHVADVGKRPLGAFEAVEPLDRGSRVGGHQRQVAQRVIVRVGGLASSNEQPLRGSVIGEGQREQIMVSLHQGGFVQKVLGLARELPKLHGGRVPEHVQRYFFRESDGEMAGRFVAFEVVFIARFQTVGEDEFGVEHPLQDLLSGLEDRLGVVLAAEGCQEREVVEAVFLFQEVAPDLEFGIGRRKGEHDHLIGEAERKYPQGGEDQIAAGNLQAHGTALVSGWVRVRIAGNQRQKREFVQGFGLIGSQIEEFFIGAENPVVRSAVDDRRGWNQFQNHRTIQQEKILMGIAGRFRAELVGRGCCHATWS